MPPLQRQLQRRRCRPPTYRLIEATGPDRLRQFRVVIVVEGELRAEGAGKNKLEAEQAAAKGMRHPNGRSLDQVIGDHIGHRSVFKTLEISCNGFRTEGIDLFQQHFLVWSGQDSAVDSRPTETLRAPV